ncbi:hypothetical protein ACFWCB_17475 [Streptomyces sp. NPDC060048]|uniref:hypothetical protein n=1 Tax=unclassified Streptomyces TaxID=2593676 RepID=UPI0036C63A6C
MNVRHKAKVRGGAAVAVAAVLALTAAGCGGDDNKSKSDETPAASQATSQSDAKPSSNTSQSPQPTEVLATSNGDPGIVLTINSAVRDPSGFVTVSGQIKNGGGEVFTKVTAWRGDERDASGTSVAGASLIDKAGKKRYYVLRDTESRCLCTTGITRIEPGTAIPFFAQFPAPPASTAQVEFTLPTFATATVKLSG